MAEAQCHGTAADVGRMGNLLLPDQGGRRPCPPLRENDGMTELPRKAVARTARGRVLIGRQGRVDVPPLRYPLVGMTNALG